MIVYFRRERDGAIITRELGAAEGVKMRVRPPAGCEPIEADAALAALAELDEQRVARRDAERATFAEGRRVAYDELIALGMSPASAAAVSGHRRVLDVEVGGGRG